MVGCDDVNHQEDAAPSMLALDVGVPGGPAGLQGLVTLTTRQDRAAYDINHIAMSHFPLITTMMYLTHPEDISYTTLYLAFQKMVS